jgi:hypothetical protein
MAAPLVKCERSALLDSVVWGRSRVLRFSCQIVSGDAASTLGGVRFFMHKHVSFLLCGLGKRERGAND